MRSLLLFCIASLVALSAARAQSVDRWDVLPVDAGFDRWYDTLSVSGDLFFSSPIHGYTTMEIPPSPPIPRRSFRAETFDGGLTWVPYTRFVPIPHTLAGRFGFSPDGYLTSDSGATWRRALDSTLVQLTASELTASAPPRYLVGLRAVGAVRQMLISTDFGATWLAADSTVTRQCIRPAGGDTVTRLGLAERTIFGRAPVDGTGTFSWSRIGGIVGSTLVVMSTNGNVRCTDLPRESFHLWHVDLDSRSASVREISTLLAQNIEGWRVLDSLRMITYAGGVRPTVYRSEDGGQSWASIGVLTVSRLHFRGSYAICEDRFSTDHGRTWQPWHSSYGTFRNFYALDSLHLFGLAPRSSAQVVRSTDGGRSWVANAAAPSYASGAIAHAGTLLVSAGPGVLLRSTDHGVTWENRWRVPGALPEGVSSLGPITFPDTAVTPNRVVAAARFATFASESFGLVVSSDAGATWQTVSYRFPAPIDQLAYAPGNGLAGFARSASELYTSSDGGSTWSRRHRQELPFVMGSDVNGIAYHEGDSRGGTLGFIVRTRDGGLSWSDTLWLRSPNNTPVGAVAFDANRYGVILPDNFQRLGQQYTAFSKDGGSTWRMLPPRSELNEILDPIFWISPAHVYSTYRGTVKYSSDSGRTFTLVRDAWPTTVTVRDDRYLYYVNLRGSIVGRWRLADDVSSVNTAAPRVSSTMSVAILENPARDIVTLEVAAANAADATILLVAADGSVVRRQRSTLIGDRTTRISIDVEGVAAGAYVVSVETPGERCSARVVIQ